MDVRSAGQHEASLTSCGSRRTEPIRCRSGTFTDTRKWTRANEQLAAVPCAQNVKHPSSISQSLPIPRASPSVMQSSDAQSATAQQVLSPVNSTSAADKEEAEREDRHAAAGSSAAPAAAFSAAPAAIGVITCSLPRSSQMRQSDPFQQGSDNKPSLVECERLRYAR
jgi:hypothetical protein